MSKGNIGVVYYPGPELSARGKFNRLALDPLIERTDAEKVTIDAYWPIPNANIGPIPILAYIDSWVTAMQYRKQLRRVSSQYDVLFISSQDFVWIDPDEVESEVIPYVHDIFPATTMFSSDIELRRSRKYVSNVMNCSRVVCASEQTKRDLYRRTSFNGKAEVVYQGVEQPSVETSERPIDLLYVGSLIERKNPEFIRESINRAIEEGYRCVAINFDDIDLQCEVISGLSEKELADMYASARYYLHPSHAEGFGRTPVEAQCHGTIPLGQSTSINREILGEPGEAWQEVTMPDDVLRALKKDVPDYHRRSATANASRYSWNRTVESLSTILNDDSL